MVQCLLVDDDSAVRRHLAAALRSDGLGCVEATSAEEALRVLMRDAVDILVSDWCLAGSMSMPRPGVLDGPELAKAIRAMGQPIPVLLYSGRDWSPEDFAAALEAGADDVVASPLERLAELKRASGASCGARPEPSTSGRT